MSGNSSVTKTNKRIIKTKVAKLDCSRPGLTMIAINAVEQQDSGGTCVTFDQSQRRRRGRHFRRKQERRKGSMDVWTLNVGAMTATELQI